MYKSRNSSLRFDTIYKNKVNNTIYESESSEESECEEGDEFFYIIEENMNLNNDLSDLIKPKENV